MTFFILIAVVSILSSQFSREGIRRSPPRRKSQSSHTMEADHRRHDAICQFHAEPKKPLRLTTQLAERCFLCREIDLIPSSDISPSWPRMGESSCFIRAATVVSPPWRIGFLARRWKVCHGHYATNRRDNSYRLIFSFLLLLYFREIVENGGYYFPIMMLRISTSVDFMPWRPMRPMFWMVFS